MKLKKGNIIWVKSEKRNPTKLKHPAVVWQDVVNEGEDFLGVMLTHSPPSERFNNILMEKAHFESGNEVVFDNTHFVNQLFMKFKDWGPFYKGGQLTKSGIEFIETHLTNTSEIDFDEYIKK